MNTQTKSSILSFITIVVISLIGLLIYKTFNKYNHPTAVYKNETPIVQNKNIDNKVIDQVHNGYTDNIDEINSDSENPPKGPLPYVNESNINELTGGIVISSPKYGDVYNLGDVINIKWDPELIDVSMAQILPVDNNIGNGIQIYSRNNLGDKESVNSQINYKIPEDFSIYPGKYNIILASYNRKNVFISDEFTIGSSYPLMQRSKSDYYIKSVFGAKDSYKIGDKIILNIEGLEKDGSIAGPDKNFNVSARIYNNKNIGIWSGNAYFDNNLNVWHIEAPVNDINAYRMQVTLYCGLIDKKSYCGQKYGYDGKNDYFISFKVE
jgi:hypothetical protein